MQPNAKHHTTKGRELVTITASPKAILLFAGATLGVAGTVVLGGADAAKVGADLILESVRLDEEAGAAALESLLAQMPGGVDQAAGKAAIERVAELEAERRSLLSICEAAGVADLPNEEVLSAVIAMRDRADEVDDLRKAIAAGAETEADLKGELAAVTAERDALLAEKTARPPVEAPAGVPSGEAAPRPKAGGKAKTTKA